MNLSKSIIWAAFHRVAHVICPGRTGLDGRWLDCTHRLFYLLDINDGNDHGWSCGTFYTDFTTKLLFLHSRIQFPRASHPL